MGNQQRSTFEEEIYLPHPKHSTIQISNFGNVIRSRDGKPKYSYICKKGYVHVSVKIKGKPKALKVHRLVAELFLPAPCPLLLEKCSNEHWKVPIVKHLDNNKQNNAYTNLAWSDHMENMKDAYRDNLIEPRKGSMNGRSTLTEDLVHLICRDYQDGMMPLQAVEKYGISRSQATKIRAGIQWKHVWEQYDIKVNRRNKCERSSTIRKE